MNHQSFPRYLLLITTIFVSWLSANAQQLNVEETINYIERNFKKYRIKGDDSISIKITETGYVIIKGYSQCIDINSEKGWKVCSSEDKFHYKSVYFKASNQGVLIMCSSPSYVNTPGCIQNWLGLNHFVDVGASFEMEGVQKINNAFQYLMDILSYDDRFNKKDDDPFSQDNYKKKILVANKDSSKQSINLKYNGNLSEISVRVCGISQDMIFDSGASDVTISSDTEDELIEKGLISKENYLTSSLDLKDWFNLKMNNPGIGSYDYKVKGGKIYFSTTSKEGSVIYHGKIKRDYYLLLKFKSLINGRTGREKYYFIKVDDLK